MSNTNSTISRPVGTKHESEPYWKQEGSWKPKRKRIVAYKVYSTDK